MRRPVQRQPHGRDVCVLTSPHRLSPWPTPGRMSSLPPSQVGRVTVLLGAGSASDGSLPGQVPRPLPESPCSLPSRH